jgi:hypothetical protein
MCQSWPRRVYVAGATFRELARRYGMTPLAMLQALTGKTWGRLRGAKTAALNAAGREGHRKSRAITARGER